jgi:hypothetical protein
VKDRAVLLSAVAEAQAAAEGRARPNKARAELLLAERAVPARAGWMMARTGRHRR